MTPIFVVARSAEVGEDFARNHPELKSSLTILTGQHSYFELMNALIARDDLSVACLVHDDVVLPQDFPQKLDSLVLRLNRDWPRWGLAGNAGVGAMRQGYTAERVVRYLSDPHGGPNLAGQILPAQSIDGNVMLLNIAAMRETGLRVPPFDGFQLYDIILSIETLYAGLAVLVAPALACWHGSKGNQTHFDAASNSKAYEDYLVSRLKNRVITTLNGRKSLPLRPQPDAARTRTIDVVNEALLASSRGRPQKTVAIVVRTRFDRPFLLSRALETIEAFIASAGDATKFQCYVVTDRAETDGCGAVPVLRANLSASGDTRYKLVQFAANEIEADFFWFVDDDDWLFPNAAEVLSTTIAASPPEAMLFLDCQHFAETEYLGRPEAVHLYSSVPKRYFSAADYFKSLAGSNHSPFPGVIFPRFVLRGIDASVYDKVVYFEDYMTIMSGLLQHRVFPVVVDSLLVGISIRKSGNTVTELDRTKWNSSMSEMTSSLVNSPLTSQMLSIEDAGSRNLLLQEQSINAELRSQLNDFGAEIMRHKAIISELTSSTSWRITRPLRGLRRILRGEFSSLFRRRGR
jgi:hypothetical protein